MNRNLSPLATAPAPTASELEEALLRALREDNAVRLSELAASLPVVPVRYLVSGEDLLTHAIRFNARHCVEPLFGMGFSMNRPSARQGLHPLEEAMEARANLTLEYLLDFGADPNAVHSRYGTILRAAAATRTIDSIIPVLCSRGADPNFPSPADGSTALHAAVSRAETLNIEQLLQAGANVNAVDIIGRTPLQFAITRLAEYDPIATLLLDHGADPLLADFGGLNAVDLARVRGEIGLIDLLDARTDWEMLLAPPDFHPPGAPRPPEILRTLLLDAVVQGNQRRIRDLFDAGGRPQSWEPVESADASPLLVALARRRLDLAAPMIARGLGVEDADAQQRNAVYYLLMATGEIALLKPFLEALHRLAPHLLAAREKSGHTQAVAAMHRGGLPNPKAVEQLIEEIRRPVGSRMEAVSPAEAERRRRARLANRARLGAREGVAP